MKFCNIWSVNRILKFRIDEEISLLRTYAKYAITGIFEQCARVLRYLNTLTEIHETPTLKN